jgi:hypothetical protein
MAVQATRNLFDIQSMIVGNYLWFMGGYRVGALGKGLLLFAIAVLLAGCAARSEIAETRSLVSATPSTKYRTVAVFIENSEGEERQVIEQNVIAVLNHAEYEAKSGSEIFAAMGALNKQEKTNRIQKSFDAVLYVNVVQQGLTEERLEDLYYDGQGILVRTNGVAWFSVSPTSGDYIIKPNGTVFKPVLAVKLRSDLQDTKTNAQVWSAETIVTGELGTGVGDLRIGNRAKTWNFSDMAPLFDKASKQIVEKMRTDSAI